jgi:hypothetical protein
MRLAGLLVLLVGVPATLAAQELRSARGTVRNAAGAPLAGAEVLLGARLATTNAQGDFRLDSLRPGPYYLTVRFAGYVPIRDRVEVSDTGPNDWHFTLQPAPFLLPPVVTELRRRGIYGAVGDTAQRPLAGVRVQVAGVNGGVVYTDGQGGFAFPAADRGVYLMRVTFPGYAERRLSLELKPGEGRQVVAVLTPARDRVSRADDQAFEGLRQRLAFNLNRERMPPSELGRYGSQGLCELPRVAAEVGRGASTTTVILNGVTVLPEYPVASLCAWGADEVDLIEFGRDICRDVTGTVGQSLPVPVWCSGRTRNVPRSMVGGSAGRIRTQGGGGSYVIIWEKR